MQNQINKQKKWVSYFKSKQIAKTEIRKIVKRDYIMSDIMSRITNNNKRSEISVINDLKKGHGLSIIIKDIKDDKDIKVDYEQLYTIIKQIFIKKTYHIQINQYKSTKFNQQILKIIKNNKNNKYDINKIKQNLNELNIYNMGRYHLYSHDRQDEINILYDIVECNDVELYQYLLGWECKNCGFIKLRQSMIGDKYILPGQDLICRVCGVIFNDEEKEEIKDNDDDDYIPNYPEFSEYVFFFIFFLFVQGLN